MYRTSEGNALDPRFKDTVLLIEATSFEQYALWVIYSKQSSSSAQNKVHILDWKEDCSGVSYCAGEINKLPVMISFTWAHWNGQRVCFYEAVSRAVDWDIVHGFLDVNFPNIPHDDCNNCLGSFNNRL